MLADLYGTGSIKIRLLRKKPFETIFCFNNDDCITKCKQRLKSTKLEFAAYLEYFEKEDVLDDKKSAEIQLIDTLFIIYGHNGEQKSRSPELSRNNKFRRPFYPDR